MKKKVLFLVVVLITSSILFGSTISYAGNYVVNNQTDTASDITSSSTFIYGDVNGDAKVDSIDYALVKSYILKIIDAFPDTNGFKAADVNGDGYVNSIDFSLIRQYILQIISVFPVEEALGEWVPYTLQKETIDYHIEQNSDGKYQIVFGITFPSPGYSVAYTDELAEAAIVLPDGTAQISYVPVMEPIFCRYTGSSPTVVTTKYIRYTLAGRGKYTFNFLGKWYDFSVQ